MKTSNNITENRALDPPAFSAVSQPAAPPRANIFIKPDFLNHNQGYTPSNGAAQLRITLALARDEFRFHWLAQKFYLKHFSISV
jgi:hypothetical protein